MTPAGPARTLGVPCRRAFRKPITVRTLSKAYPTRDGDVVALDRISFSVPESEFVSVVGPSGCEGTRLIQGDQRFWLVELRPG